MEQRYFPHRQDTAHTLSEAIDKYASEVLAFSKPGTARVRAPRLLWWKTRLGSSRLSDLSHLMLTPYLTELRLQFAPSTVNGYLSILSIVLTKCVNEWGWMTDSPTRKVRKVPHRPSGSRFLTDVERGNLIAACRESRSPYLYPAVILALFTGGRRNEILALKWSDVDLTRGTVTFRDTKNGETRSAALLGTSLGVLQRLSHTGPYVFQRGHAHLSSLQDAWERARRVSNLTNFRFHDLRHTFASYLAMSGASLLEIAEALGHKDLRMVKRYAHLTESHTRTVIERMVNTFLSP